MASNTHNIFKPYLFAGLLNNNSNKNKKSTKNSTKKSTVKSTVNSKGPSTEKSTNIKVLNTTSKPLKTIPQKPLTHQTVENNNNNNDPYFMPSVIPSVMTSTKVKRSNNNAEIVKPSSNLSLKITENNRAKMRTKFRIYSSGNKFINNKTGFPQPDIKLLDIIAKLTTSKDKADNDKHNKVKSSKDLIMFKVKSKIKPTKTYIIKFVTFSLFDRETPMLKHCLENEIIFYNQIMYNLVLNNITPYVLMGISYYKKKNQIIFINETAEEGIYDSISLYKFINTYKNKITTRIMLNILFQIIYTLKCFNAINFKHQDLHLDNILLFIDSTNNILQDTWKVSNSTHKFILSNTGDPIKDEIYLENIGIHVRIFDFDRSIKHKSTSKINELNIECLYTLNGEEYLLLNNSINPYHDTYKVLALMYDLFFKIATDKKTRVDVKNQILEILKILLNYIPITSIYLQKNPNLFTTFYRDVMDMPNIYTENLNLHNAFDICKYQSIDGEPIILAEQESLEKLFPTDEGNPYLLKVLSRKQTNSKGEVEYVQYTPTADELLSTGEYLYYLVEFIKALPQYNDLETHEIIETYDFTKL